MTISRSSRFRRARTLCVGITFVLLVTACTSSGTQDESTTSSAASETTTEADESTTSSAASETTTTEAPMETFDVRIASASSSLTAGLMLTALSLDTYGDHGITVDYTDFRGSSSNPIAALLGGSADIALVGTATALNAMAEGAPLVVISGLAGNTSELGVATAIVGELDATESSTTAERVQALRGRIIATAAEGSSNAQMLRSLLILYGIDPDKDVTIVPSDPTAIISGLKNGLYDAAFYGTGIMENNYADGSAIPWVVLPRGDVPDLEAMAFAVTVTTEEILQDQANMIEAYHASLVDAGAALDADSEAVAKVVKAAWFPDMDETVYYLSWDIVNAAWPRDAAISQASWDFTIGFVDETAERDLSGLGFETYVAELARR